MPDDLLIEQDGHVLIATMNNPERRNALNQGIREGISEAIARTDADDSVRVLVLTGAGRSFCAGADVSDLSRGAEAAQSGGGARMIDMRGKPEPGHRAGGFDFSLMFWGMRKPTIAALPGPAVGAGFGLAMCCDMRVAAESARVAAGFSRMALSAEYGLSFVLPRIIGASRTFELMYTGRFIDAQEMDRIGLVSRVVPDDRLMESTLELASAIAAMPPLAMERIRQGIHRGMESKGFREQVEYEAYLQSLGLNSRDHQEATRAFIEKRKPEWQGR